MAATVAAFFIVCWHKQKTSEAEGHPRSDIYKKLEKDYFFFAAAFLAGFLAAAFLAGFLAAFFAAFFAGFFAAFFAAAMVFSPRD